MTDEQSYRYPVTIGIEQVNENGALTPRAYQQLYMQVINPHLERIGMDEARLMGQYRVAWVLLSMSFELRRQIRPRDRLYARTWNSGGSRLMYRRELALFDEYDEPVLIGATFSTLLDLERRRVCIDPEMAARFALPVGETHMKAADRLRLRTPEDSPAQTLSVLPSWIDGVGHVNNCRYGDFLYDALTDAQRARMSQLRRLELYFVSETRLGETLLLHRADAPDGALVTVSRPDAARPAFAGKLLFA